MSFSFRVSDMVNIEQQQQEQVDRSCLFRGVSNAPSMREKLISGSLEAAILDCGLVSFITKVCLVLPMVCRAVHHIVCELRVHLIV